MLYVYHVKDLCTKNNGNRFLMISCCFCRVRASPLCWRVLWARTFCLVDLVNFVLICLDLV